MGLVSTIESNAITLSVRIKSYPEQVWEAWMEVDRLAQWLVDKATGWPGVGSTLALTWERFNCTIDYQVAEAKPCEKLVWKTRMPAGFQTLTIGLRREGPLTVVELRESAPDNAPDVSESSSESSWQMSLAILKLYLENYFGQDRQGFFTIKKADFDCPTLLHYYCSAEGLSKWFAHAVEEFPDPAGDVTDQPYRLQLSENLVMTGRVLTRTRNEVCLSWSEISGYLELKCFDLGPGQQAICLRGFGYGLSESSAQAVETMLGERLSILAGLLTATES